MPWRSILKVPTPPPKRRSSLSLPWAGANPKKSVKWPDTKTIGETALSYLSPLGSRLGLSCLRSRQPTFSTQLEEVYHISPNPSQPSGTPTPLWLKRHLLGAALLPGESYDEEDEEDGDASSTVAENVNETWFCGQIERPTEDNLQSWLVGREASCLATGSSSECHYSFAVAEDPEDAQESPCSTEEYDQSSVDASSNPEMVVKVVLQPLEAAATLQSDLIANETEKPAKRRHIQSADNFESDCEGKENAAPPSKRARWSVEGNGLLNRVFGTRI